jgi:hypothetical protein
VRATVESVRGVDHFVKIAPTVAGGCRFQRITFTQHRLNGTLTLRGVTKQVDLDLNWQGAAPDPFRDGETHLALPAIARISLADFGMPQPLLGDLAIAAIGDAVQLTIDAVLLPYDPAPMLNSIPID